MILLQNLEIQFFTGLLISLLIGGCQNPRARGHLFYEAPTSEKELGVIVDQLTPTDVQNLMEERGYGIRPLSLKSGTYEVYGPSLEKISELFPNKPASKNHFLKNPETPFSDTNKYKTTPPSQIDQLEIIKVKNLWSQTKGKGVRIAVIDTGLAWDHFDFEDQRRNPDFNPGWNFSENNLDLSDRSSHGTAVAGLIASRFVGVAPESQIIPLKVMSPTGHMDEGTVLSALKYAIDKKIKLINLSAGIQKLSPLFLDTLTVADSEGTLIITAAGNYGLSCDTYKLYPGALDIPSILNIGATALKIENPFTYTSYSNFGNCVTLAAPGGTLEMGLWAPYWESKNSQSLYSQRHGTSMAAPLVTGSSALLLSLHPDWKGSDIKNFLIQSSSKSEDLSGYVKSEGLLQIPSISAESGILYPR